MEMLIAVLIIIWVCQLCFILEDSRAEMKDRLIKTKKSFIIMVIPFGFLYLFFTDIVKDIIDFYKTLK